MKLRNLLSISLGNTLEWFDFGLFIFLAPVIGAKFFPTEDANSATLAALGVFAAGFIARPLGGILFGHLGDRQGRSKTLRYSILMITSATFLVGILPTYETAGIFASILFTILRIIQGLSVGGEYGGIMIYLAESAPDKKRGFLTSFAATGANLGFLLATLVVILMKSLLPEASILAWGWRLPFVAIGGFGMVLFYYRLKLLETPAYLHLKEFQYIQKKPLLNALRQAPGPLLKILGLSCMNSTYYYVFFGYMPNYLSQNLGVPSNIAFTIQSILLIIMLFLVPIAGICGDRFGRNNMLLITATSIILLTIPCFYLLNSQTISAIILAWSIATLLSSMDQGNSLTAVVETCPVNVRYSGISFAYNVGTAIFGGTAPLVVNLLAGNVSNIAPAYYLMFTAAITLSVVLTLAHNHKINFMQVIKGSSEETLQEPQ